MTQFVLGIDGYYIGMISLGHINSKEKKYFFWVVYVDVDCLSNK